MKRFGWAFAPYLLFALGIVAFASARGTTSGAMVADDDTLASVMGGSSGFCNQDSFQSTEICNGQGCTPQTIFQSGGTTKKKYKTNKVGDCTVPDPEPIGESGLQIDAMGMTTICGQFTNYKGCGFNR